MLSQFNNFHKVTCFLTLIVTEWNLMRSLKGGRWEAGMSDVQTRLYSLPFVLLLAPYVLRLNTQYLILTPQYPSTTSAIFPKISSISPTPCMVESLPCFL